jgi:hypothetical protein
MKIEQGFPVGELFFLFQGVTLPKEKRSKGRFLPGFFTFQGVTLNFHLEFSGFLMH